MWGTHRVENVLPSNLDLLRATAPNWKMDTARSLTPNEVIEKAESRDFLMQCLRRTKLDPDLLEDVADACELQDPVLTSILLACGTLTPEETSNKLFLMLDEASLLLAQCKNECLRIGVDFGDGSLFDPSGDNSTGNTLVLVFYM